MQFGRLKVGIDSIWPLVGCALEGSGAERGMPPQPRTALAKNGWPIYHFGLGTEERHRFGKEGVVRPREVADQPGRESDDRADEEPDRRAHEFPLAA